MSGKPVRDLPGAAQLGLHGRLLVAALVAVTVGVAVPVVARLGPGTHGWVTFGLLAAGAAASQLFVVLTPRSQSYHASIVFLVAAVLLLPPELVVLIALIQQAPEWLRLRTSWPVQLFGACNFALSGLAAWEASHLLHADSSVFGDGGWAAAATIACAVFVAVNHGLHAVMLLALRGITPRASGMLSIEGLGTDIVLAALGVSLAGFWHWNHWLVPFALLPLILAHRSFRVPALQEQARSDAKTGLLNPRAFREALDHELARALRFGRPLSVIVADLDHLRDVNNTHGHLAGDAVLVGIADVLRHELRDYDLAARFGGEEFAILLPETGYAEAVEIADRVRRAVAQAVHRAETTGVALRVTMSMGVAASPDHAGEADLLLQRADEALYRAKSDGRNRVVGWDAVRPPGTPPAASAACGTAPDGG